MLVDRIATDRLLGGFQIATALVVVVLTLSPSTIAWWRFTKPSSLVDDGYGCARDA
jgi:hypothetical protein